MTNLSDDDINEVIGDGTCTHLPQVRMALEIRRHRAAQVVDTIGIYLTEQERRHVTNVLNDLEVREQAAIRSREGPEAATYAAEHAALKKLMYLPASAMAVAASKERVREVVCKAVLRFELSNVNFGIADEVARRAAEQLAGAAVGCNINPASSRACELGTRGCVREHGVPVELSEEESAVLRRAVQRLDDWGTPDERNALAALLDRLLAAGATR